MNTGCEAVLGIIGLVYHALHALKAGDTAEAISRAVARRIICGHSQDWTKYLLLKLIRRQWS